VTIGFKWCWKRLHVFHLPFLLPTLVCSHLQMASLNQLFRFLFEQAFWTAGELAPAVYHFLEHCRPHVAFPGARSGSQSAPGQRLGWRGYHRRCRPGVGPHGPTRAGIRDRGRICGARDLPVSVQRRAAMSCQIPTWGSVSLVGITNSTGTERRLALALRRRPPAPHWACPTTPEM
jgi:hypothetical protein